MCKTYRKMLQPFLDGEISQLEQLFLEEHLSVCRDCRRELNQLKVLEWDLQYVFKEIQVPSELSQLRKKIMEECFTSQDNIKKARQGKGERIDVWGLSFRNMKNTIRFIKYLPGQKMVKSAVENRGDTMKKTLKKYSFNIIGR